MKNLIFWLALLISGPLAADDHRPDGGKKLGTVDFAVSCTPAAQEAFNVDRHGVEVR